MKKANQILRHHNWSQVISVVGFYIVQEQKAPKPCEEDIAACEDLPKGNLS